MIRMLIVFGAFMCAGMTSRAPLAHSQTHTNVPISDSLAVRRAVIAVDNQWRAAKMRNDAVLLDSVLAEEWTTTVARPGGMGFAGMVITRARFLADVKSGERSYESIENGETSVRFYGEAVVLTSRTTSKGYFKDQRTNETAVFTRLYAMRAGRWQMIASRSAAIVQL